MDFNVIITGISTAGMVLAIFMNLKTVKKNTEAEAIEIDRLKVGIEIIKTDVSEIKADVKLKISHNTEIENKVAVIASEQKTLWKRLESLEERTNGSR